MNAIFPFSRMMRGSRAQMPGTQTPPATPRRSDPQTRLVRQITALAGPGASALRVAGRPWSSATFVGAQHEMDVLVPTTRQAEALGEALAQAEFRIPGHIVADAVLDERRRMNATPEMQEAGDGDAVWLCRITALTIEEW